VGDSAGVQRSHASFEGSRFRYRAGYTPAFEGGLTVVVSRCSGPVGGRKGFLRTLGAGVRERSRGQQKSPGTTKALVARRGLGGGADVPLDFFKKSLTPRTFARPERADWTTVDICRETGPAPGGLRVA